MRSYRSCAEISTYIYENVLRPERVHVVRTIIGVRMSYSHRRRQHPRSRTSSSVPSNIKTGTISPKALQISKPECSTRRWSPSSTVDVQLWTLLRMITYLAGSRWTIVKICPHKWDGSLALCQSVRDTREVWQTFWRSQSRTKPQARFTRSEICGRCLNLGFNLAWRCAPNPVALKLSVWRHRRNVCVSADGNRNYSISILFGIVYILATIEYLGT